MKIELVNVLKRFYKNPNMEDYNYLKGKLKFLEILLNHMNFENLEEVNTKTAEVSGSITGDFVLQENMEEFNYFCKELIKLKDECK